MNSKHKYDSVNRKVAKMAEAARKKTKRITSARKTQKITKSETKAAEYVSCLLELHKLQGVLLHQLGKEVQ
jgi:hypothetical protein